MIRAWLQGRSSCQRLLELPSPIAGIGEQRRQEAVSAKQGFPLRSAGA
jgi:hypothetical protein